MAARNHDCKLLFNVYCIHSSVNIASALVIETETLPTNLFVISDIYQVESIFHLFIVSLAIYVFKLESCEAAHRIILPYLWHQSKPSINALSLPTASCCSCCWQLVSAVGHKSLRDVQATDRQAGRDELIAWRTSFTDSHYVVREFCRSIRRLTAGDLDSIALTLRHHSQRMRYFTGGRDAWRGSGEVTPSTACVRPFDQRRL